MDDTQRGAGDCWPSLLKQHDSNYSLRPNKRQFRNCALARLPRITNGPRQPRPNLLPPPNTTQHTYRPSKANPLSYIPASRKKKKKKKRKKIGREGAAEEEEEKKTEKQKKGEGGGKEKEGDVPLWGGGEEEKKIKRKGKEDTGKGAGGKGQERHRCAQQTVTWSGRRGER